MLYCSRDVAGCQTCNFLKLTQAEIVLTMQQQRFRKKASAEHITVTHINHMKSQNNPCRLPVRIFLYKLPFFVDSIVCEHTSTNVKRICLKKAKNVQLHLTLMNYALLSE